MRKFFATTLITAGLLCSGTISNHALAGLGEASSVKPKAYDAWCGKRNNKCKVSFANGRITVNNKDSIAFEEVTFIGGQRDYECGAISCHFISTFNVEYAENGNTGYAKFIFMHFPTAKQFWNDLQRACKDCRKRPERKEIKFVD